MHILAKYPASRLLLVFIILISIFLRYYHLNYMEFKGDEAKNSFKALKFASEGDLPLTSGISSTGINEPPVFIYLLALPYLFSSDPVFATGFIALLNVLGIVLCYFFMKKFYSIQAALIAIALYAVNPWQILYSRKIWTQNLVAPFIILFLWFFFNAVYNKKKNHIIYAFVTLGIIVQLHLAAAYFIIPVAVVVALNRNVLSKKMLLTGLILFLATLVPYLIFQFQNNFTDLHTLIALFHQENRFHPEAFTIPFKLITTLGFDYSFGTDFPEFKNTGIHFLLLDGLLSLLLLLSFCFLFYKPEKKNIFLCVWLVAGLIYIATNKIPDIKYHYFDSFFPLFFIAIAIMISRISDLIPLYGRRFLYGILAILILYQFVFNFHLLNFIKNKQCISGDYGVPYFYRENAIRKIINPLHIDTIHLNSKRIHDSACQCRKCDFLATQFIIKKLRPDDNSWPEPGE